MTERKKKKLAREILGLLGASLAATFFFYEFLMLAANEVMRSYCERQAVVLSEMRLTELEAWAFGAGLVTAVLFFVFLFLTLLGRKLGYIRTLTEGVEALQAHRMDLALPLEGNNELTRLAESINYLSATEKAVREKEKALHEEKEQLIRSLSHDIRTPLTSILAYSEYLSSAEEAPAEERQRQLRLIREKAEQIRRLTDVLLEGGRRALEYFADARLLMEQLAGEFEEALEEDFAVETELASCAAFSGSFDVQELRRVFDNLASNVKKYADAAYPVRLSVKTEEGLVLRQENRKSAGDARGESFGIGLDSIRRIAQQYGGSVTVEESETDFAVTVRLCSY